MRTRAFVALSVIAGMAAGVNAQSATLTWHWQNMTEGGHTPVEVGHDVGIWFDIVISPGPGQIVAGNLENRGIASVFVDLYSQGNTFGSWFVDGFHSTHAFPGTPEVGGFGTNVPLGYTGPGSMPLEPLHWGRRNDWFHGGWGFGGNANYQPDGSLVNSAGSLAAIQAGQFAAGTTSNTQNPVHELWRGLFTAGPENTYGDGSPLVWTPRKAEASLTTGITILVRPQGTTDPFTTLQIPALNIDWGTLSIPTIPSPSSLALLGLGGLLLARRRR
jgi:hypothetical protein